MADTRVLNTTTYWVFIGVSVVGNRVCVAVSTENISTESILNPPNGRKYIVHTVFMFDAQRKIPYASIIGTLKNCGIFPKGDKKLFNPPDNPDNKYYIDLLYNELDLIISIVRKCVEGMTIRRDLTSKYVEHITPIELFNEVQKQNQPKLTLQTPAIYVINQDGYTIHRINIK